MPGFDRSISRGPLLCVFGQIAKYWCHEQHAGQMAH